MMIMKAIVGLAEHVEHIDPLEEDYYEELKECLRLLKTHSRYIEQLEAYNTEQDLLSKFGKVTNTER